jgi:hypothetical protein
MHEDHQLPPSSGETGIRGVVLPFTLCIHVMMLKDKDIFIFQFKYKEINGLSKTSAIQKPTLKKSSYGIRLISKLLVSDRPE